MDAGGLKGEVGGYSGLVGAAEGHECDVIFHKFYFSMQWHAVGGCLVERVSEYFAKSGEVFLRFVGVGVYLTGDVVHRIEEKVRVELVFEPLELRLLVFAFFLEVFHAFHVVPDAYCSAYYKAVGEQVGYQECEVAFEIYVAE